MKFIKAKEVEAENIPFAAVEVWFPKKESWNTQIFYELTASHIDKIKEMHANYDRKETFSQHPYFRFFRKSKKTYPIMMQLESILLQGREFPHENPVVEIAFLIEIETLYLLGSHDADKTSGDVTINIATKKLPFTGIHGNEAHTYAGDIYGVDDEGIIFSMIAGADNRTCIHEDSSHVFYPIFGIRDQDWKEIDAITEKICEYVKILAPDAEIIIHSNY